MSYDCWCDYDRPEFWRQSKPRARKEYRCYECGGPIAPGEQYESVAGKWAGEFDTFATCERCYDIRQWVTNNVPCFCWAHGNMLDDARETMREASIAVRNEVTGLWFAFLRKVVLLNRHNKLAKKAARP